MLTRHTHLSRRSGFTLIELLTVVSIIALLISILLPSLARARDQAKRLKISAQLSAIDKGLEMFQNDFGQYPDSGLGKDALTNTGSLYTTAGRNLSGAHWLARAMLGYDTKGIDAKGATLTRLTGSNTVDVTSASLKDRKGPYVEGEVYRRDSDSEKFQSAGGGDFDPTERTVLYEDSYRSPILYYRANSQGDLAFKPSSSVTYSGIYNMEDNQEITGSATASRRGWNFTGQATLISGSNVLHRLGIFGATVSGSTMTLTSSSTDPQSFARYLYSESSMSAAGVLKPVRPDSFVLITAGKDGIFGTADDVNNFKSAN